MGLLKMDFFEKTGRWWRNLHVDAERWSFMRSTITMMLVRIGGVSLAFLSSMVMARLLGAQGYGLYAYVMAIAAVLSLPAALGLPQYLVREATGHMAGALRLRRWADHRVIVAGALMALMMLLAAWFTSDIERRCLFALAALIPLLNALSEVRRSLLQANGLVARSQLAPLLFVPLAMLVGMAALWHFYARIEAWEVMVMTVAAAGLPFLVNGLQLRALLTTAKGRESAHIPAVTTRAAMRFMWLGALYLLISRTDLIMLGIFSGDEDAGVYAVASRAADLVPLLLISANMVIAPRIADLYRNGELEKLQKLLTTAMRLIVIASLPLTLLLFFGAGWLLPLFYGEAYADGALVLRLLVLAQFILVLGGPLGTTLEMTGNEKASLAVMAWVACLNIAMNALLIPVFAANGAAVATCASVIVGRILLWRKVRQLVTLRSTALGI